MNHQSPAYLNTTFVRPAQNPDMGIPTHQVQNMPPELPDQNLFSGDNVLVNAVKDNDIAWATERLETSGQKTGSRHIRELARLANEHLPILKTHDRIGQRIDFVEFHPAYHELMSEAFGSGVHSLC